MRAAVLAVALCLAACASPPKPGMGETTAGGGGASAPTDMGDIDFGDVAKDPDTLIKRYAASLSRRVPIGMETGAAISGLKGQGFVCAPTKGVAGGQTCRRTRKEGDCSHVWQAFLVGADGKITRVRPSYDRACGSDGLLGGPG